MVILGLALVALAGLTVAYLQLRTVNNQLTTQLKEKESQEKKSQVLASISAQMEEIAYEQKNISDEQREEAFRQSRLANEMRERSEMERQNAIIAQHNAIASEQKALDAYDQAEQQRRAAERLRIQAEFSKRVADTLSYVALGRSLGSMSLAQWDAGNRDEACLLSSAAYHYTRAYNANIYYPSVYQSLFRCSQSLHSWTVHDGVVTDIRFSTAHPKQLVSVTNYGEVSVHEKQGNRLQSRTLLKDSHYDFRNCYIRPSTGDIYAIDRNGNLYIHHAKGHVIIPLIGILHPFALDNLKDDRYLLIVGEDGLMEWDMDTNTLIAQRKVNFKPVYSSRFDYSPILFDDKGKMHIIRTIDKIESREVPVPGQVTAFASSKNQHYEVYGMDNGTIYLVDANREAYRLVGHRSRISKLKTNGARLYSSGYDGTVNLWMTNSEKMEPMTLLSVDNWIMNFTFDVSKNYLWVCDQHGTLSEALISVEMMAEQVNNSLERDFTDKEWNYYIGKNIPRIKVKE